MESQKQKVGFKPRLSFILCKTIMREAEETMVSGDPRNPTIIEKGELIEIKNWVEVVRENANIGDLKEGDIVFFSGRAMELNYQGTIYLLIKDEDMFGSED